MQDNNDFLNPATPITSVRTVTVTSDAIHTTRIYYVCFSYKLVKFVQILSCCGTKKKNLILHFKNIVKSIKISKFEINNRIKVTYRT